MSTPTLVTNGNLGAAKIAKADEFYTQLTDIEKEMKHYREHFKGKVVYLNCDDPATSKFFHFFAHSFEFLGLKKLIATSYNQGGIGTVIEYDGDRNGNNLPDPDEITAKPLMGDGDFRSAECIELLKQVDIVVTNPPFSLFREYIAQLVEFDKKFIVLGNMNALKYKDIWPLIKGNKLWYGPSIHSGDREFGVPDSYPLNAAGCRVGEDGQKYIRVKGVRWFTNLDHPQRHESLILFKKYDPIVYPTHDNFDAIDVSSYRDIPADYDGVMGVPITLLDYFNPDQFEIIGNTESWSGNATKMYPQQIQVNPDGSRITVSKLNYGAAIEVQNPPTDKTYYEVDGRYFVKKYTRILIRRKGAIE